MSDFLTTFLASILHEQGVEDPGAVAKRVADDLRMAKIVSVNGIKRAAIIADPCVDYRVVRRRYEVSTSFVYNAWGERLSAHKE